MNRIQTDVTILGAGLVGLTAALACAQQGYHVTVIEKNRQRAYEQDLLSARAFAIRSQSQKLWADLSVWGELRRKTPVYDMKVFDNAAEQFFDFSGVIAPGEALVHIVEEPIAHEALMARVHQESHIDIIWEKSVDAFFPMQDKVQLELDDSLIDSRVVLIAEGAQSPSRKKLGIAVEKKLYQQQACVCNLKLEHPHRSQAYQWFGEKGPLAFLPLSDEQTVSIVWSLPQAHQTVLDLDELEFAQAIEEYSQGLFGRVDVIGKRYQFELAATHATAYVQDRCVLLGDSAHVIHPLAGLGVNLGLSDVARLLRYLTSIDLHSTQLKKALRQFERESQYENRKVSLLMDGLNVAFMQSSLAPVRKVALPLFQKSSLLKYLSHSAVA